MHNTKPPILGDMFNYYNACGTVSAMVALYYNNDFREKIENFYNNQNSEDLLNKIFPKAIDPDVISHSNAIETKKAKEKQKKIAIAIRNFWHAHLKGDELCSPFGKVWAFNRLAEALELPRRMYVPSTNHNYVSGTTGELIEVCKKALTSETYNGKDIEQCNNLWNNIKAHFNNVSYVKLCDIFEDNENNIVKPDDNSVVLKILKKKYPTNVDLSSSQRRGPNDIFQILIHMGARFNLSQYGTKEYEDEDNGYANCVIDNEIRDHHEAFITLDQNDGYGFFYDLLKQDALERHVEPTQVQGRYHIDKSEQNKKYQWFGGEKVFTGYKQQCKALANELKADQQLSNRIEQLKNKKHKLKKGKKGKDDNIKPQKALQKKHPQSTAEENRQLRRKLAKISKEYKQQQRYIKNAKKIYKKNHLNIKPDFNRMYDRENIYDTRLRNSLRRKEKEIESLKRKIWHKEKQYY